ncbi:MAG: hypothetical protein ABIJ21_06580 [Nanoarchaeota archaeon]
MAIEKESIRTLDELNTKMHNDTEAYVHSRTLAVTSSHLILPHGIKFPFSVTYDLKDLLLIGAITESPILMTGGTDTGKTTLAKLVMNSLLGSEEQGWHKLDFDTDFGRDSVSDVSSDFFQKEGMTLSDFYRAQPWLSLPGFIADELNRTHAKQSAKALHIIGEEKEITLPNGQRVKIGMQLPDGTTYQFQIATINEGKDYSGTFDIDKALRRRTTIEIPMDVFSLTARDEKILRERDGKPILLPETVSQLETILSYRKVLQDINLHPLADLYNAYIESFDYCKHSFTGDKDAVAKKQGSIRHVCAKPMQIGNTEIQEGIGCEYLVAFKHEMCPYVSGLTPGISGNLRKVAKGFTLLRATKFVEFLSAYVTGDAGRFTPEPGLVETALQDYTETPLTGRPLAKKALAKYVDNLEVLQEDFESAFVFVAYSKIGISPLWIEKHYQGSIYGAVQAFSNEVSGKFKDGLAAPASQEILVDLLNGTKGREDAAEFAAYCEKENPWLLRAVAPYMDHREEKSTQDIKDDLYT